LSPPDTTVAPASAGLNPKASEIFTRIAVEKIVVKGVTVQGVIEITSIGSRGVEEIRNEFLKIKDLGEQDEATISIYTLGSPKYRLEVTCEDFKKAEITLDKLVKSIEQSWSKREGTFSFKREKVA